MSQIATTIEQSRRLMLAAVSPDSADMYWIGSGATISPEEDDYKLVAEPFRPQNERLNDLRAKAVADRDKYGFDTSADIAFIDDILVRTIPAWSLSRLWDAFGLDILGGWFSVGSSKSEDVIEELVRMMEQLHANDSTLSKELLK